MRLLLDTNVIIAAFAAHGLCKDIFRQVIERETLIVSEALLAEIQKNLNKKLKLSLSRAKTVTSFISSRGILVVPVPVPVSACRDPLDLHVLGAAVAGNANLIITGDKDLLELKRFKKILIYSPRQAWLHLNLA